MLCHLQCPTLAPIALLYSIYIPGDPRVSAYFSALWINRIAIAWTAFLSNSLQLSRVTLNGADLFLTQRMLRITADREVMFGGR